MKTFYFLILLMFSTNTIFAADIKNHIVILLDTSYSMEEQMIVSRSTKWTAAKTALMSTVDQIPENTEVGLMTFADNFYPLQKLEKSTLKQVIQNAEITKMSGTPLGTYMKKAADILLKSRAENGGYGFYKLIVVTDGDPTKEPEGLVDQYTADIISRGIRVECIGVSMLRPSVLKSKVNRYMSADDPAALANQIQETVLAEVVSKDDLSGFEELAGLDVSTTSKVIEELTKMENHPIGEEPPPPPKILIEEPQTEQADQPIVTPKVEAKSGFTSTKLLCAIVIIAMAVGFLVFAANN